MAKNQDEDGATSTGWEMRCQYFRAGAFTGWDEVFLQAADFATKVGRERVVSISHSEDSNVGVVAVWYWAEAGQPTLSAL